MHQRDVLGDVSQFDHPVKRRIAAAEDREFLARELLRVADAVMQVAGSKIVDAGQAQLPRLERADTAAMTTARA